MMIESAFDELRWPCFNFFSLVLKEITFDNYSQVNHAI